MATEPPWTSVFSEEQIRAAFGFVYEIERTNAAPGEKRFYWGCKQLYGKRLQPAKAGKRRTRKTVESDWRKYWGSSRELKEDIARHGLGNFRREILKLTTCKWELKWEELATQLEKRALLRDDSYNGIIHVRLGRPPQHLRGEK